MESPFFGKSLLVEGAIQAGFPSSSGEEFGLHLNLQELMVPHPHATFFVRVVGDSMVGAKIFSQDLLVVDRSIPPTHRSIVVAVVNKEFTVKRLIYEKNRPVLVPENPLFSPIHFSNMDELEIFGVVTYVIHKT